MVVVVAVVVAVIVVVVHPVAMVRARVVAMAGWGAHRWQASWTFHFSAVGITASRKYFMRSKIVSMVVPSRSSSTGVLS